LIDVLKVEEIGVIAASVVERPALIVEIEAVGGIAAVSMANLRGGRRED
jgi:hypothetical protein